MVASVFGLVRAGLLLASVMVFDHGMAVVVDQQATDVHQAAATWQAIETVADGLGGTGGDVLLGLWLLLVSWAALRSSVFPRALNWLGLGVGVAALVSLVPGLGFLEVVVGLLQIVWFLWFGLITARTGPTEPARAGE